MCESLVDAKVASIYDVPNLILLQKPLTTGFKFKNLTKSLMRLCAHLCMNYFETSCKLPQNICVIDEHKFRRCHDGDLALLSNSYIQ